MNECRELHRTIYVCATSVVLLYRMCVTSECFRALFVLFPGASSASSCPFSDILLSKCRSVVLTKVRES